MHGGNGIRLVFQQDIPMQKIVLSRPAAEGILAGSTFYNMAQTTFVEDPDEKGFLVASLSNVPAYKVEPQDAARGRGAEMGLRKILRHRSGRNMAVGEPEILAVDFDICEADEPIQKKAAELLQGATTDDEKLRRIYAYIKKDIRNVDFDTTLTDDDRDKLDYDHAEDTSRLRMGNSIYVELLFAALARAAGYEVNLVFSGDRSDSFFSPDNIPSPHSFISPVWLSKSGTIGSTSTRVFRISPTDFLTWNEEGVTAMLSRKTASCGETPRSLIRINRPAKRTANLALLEDGTLEGTIKLEYSGQQAITRRRDNFRESEAKIKENAEDQIKSRMSNR
jgi:hypothetical protein